MTVTGRVSWRSGVPPTVTFSREGGPGVAGGVRLRNRVERERNVALAAGDCAIAGDDLPYRRCAARWASRGLIAATPERARQQRRLRVELVIYLTQQLGADHDVDDDRCQQNRQRYG
jgi:hypothetical protein